MKKSFILISLFAAHVYASDQFRHLDVRIFSNGEIGRPLKQSGCMHVKIESYQSEKYLAQLLHLQLGAYGTLCRNSPDVIDILSEDDSYDSDDDAVGDLTRFDFIINRKTENSQQAYSSPHE